MSVGFQQPLKTDLRLGVGIHTTPKLVADSHTKKNYIAHYRILQEYIKMGVKVTKVHKALGFTQFPWMKDFIDSNTKMRSKARTEFEKSFWKLMNNRYEECFVTGFSLLYLFFYFIFLFFYFFNCVFKLFLVFSVHLVKRLNKRKSDGTSKL